MSDGLRTGTKAAGPHAQAPARAGLLQRKCACGGAAGITGHCPDCDVKRLTLQRSATRDGGLQAVPPIVDEVIAGAGEPLDPQARARMESHLGHDFGRVRVHTDARAAESARAVNALAYTVGQQVVFGEGQYRPDTQAGRRLLAHELAHAARQGDVGRFQGKLEIGSPDSADEREADRAAEAVEGQAGVSPRLPRGHTGPPVLRRKTGDTGSWFRGLFSSMLFGTFWFPESWLQDYLKKLDETGDIEGDPDSDDKAREIVNEWKKGGSPFVLTARRKALLIHEMLDGPTTGADEDAILEILERSYNYELSYIFGPEGGVTPSRLGEDIPDGEGERLPAFYVYRFEGAKTALLRGEVKPYGKPIPLGVELPPVGVPISENVPFDDGTTGWNVPCVLGILCTLDSSIVRQLPALTVKTMDDIVVRQWTFDGTSWKGEDKHPTGFNKPDERLVGLVRRSNCNKAAQTMFHEVRHQNQPADLKKTHYTMEVDAYTKTEEWAIKRGLPEELSGWDSVSLRKTDRETGKESPSEKAIKEKVTKMYGGPTPEPGGQVVGHEGTNKSKVELPDGTCSVRRAEKGDTYLEEPPRFSADQQAFDPAGWECPKEKTKPAPAAE